MVQVLSRECTGGCRTDSGRNWRRSSDESSLPLSWRRFPLICILSSARTTTETGDDRKVGPRTYRGIAGSRPGMLLLLIWVPRRSTRPGGFGRHDEHLESAMERVEGIDGPGRDQSNQCGRLRKKGVIFPLVGQDVRSGLWVVWGDSITVRDL